jgi:hypothetical protein
MTNQDLQRATSPGVVGIAIAKLQDFIAGCCDACEARKALAVKLVYQNYLYKEIQTILDVSLGSITGGKKAYEQDIEHSRHRSPLNFLVNLMAGLAAYTYFPKKPSIDIYPKDSPALPPAFFIAIELTFI